MAIRFGKRIKVAPGVRVNLSKSGISTTLGPRGASVNVGKKGVHTNLSIPGTGVSVRSKVIGGKSAAKGPSPSAKLVAKSASEASEVQDPSQTFDPLGKSRSGFVVLLVAVLVVFLVAALL